MSLTITRCAHVNEVPPALAEAFQSMPHYRSTDPHRDSVDGWDPLSTSNEHNAPCYLTGFALAGITPGKRAVYVLRFNESMFAAYVTGRVMFFTASKAEAEEKARELTEQTWTFVGHWEGDRIVVEYVLPGEQQDEREDAGYWPEGLWAASAKGTTQAEAQAAAIAEYETADEDDEDTSERDTRKARGQIGWEGDDASHTLDFMCTHCRASVDEDGRDSTDSKGCDLLNPEHQFHIVGPPERTWPETTEEHRAFSAWQTEVANGDTLHGFRDYLAALADAA